MAKAVQLSTLLGPQSRFGDKLLGIWVVCPQNGTAVLKGLAGRSFKDRLDTNTQDQKVLTFQATAVIA